MSRRILFLGSFSMLFMAYMCYFADGNFIGARPYAAAATTLGFMAMAVN